MRPEDDQWIMVEDEFLATAQLYTRSVHRKEYERLQSEAASKNASQISNIQRPVTGKCSLSKDVLKKREIAAERLREDDSSDDDRSGGATSELRMLMRAGTGSQATLRNFLRPKAATTRAAAGYTNSQIPTVASQRREKAAAAARRSIPSPPRRVPSPPRQPVECMDSDDDEDLDAVVRRREYGAVSQADAVRPQVESETVMPKEPVFQPVLQPTRPVDLDDDDDDFLDRPKPSTRRFKGKAMAARERANKERRGKLQH